MFQNSGCSIRVYLDHSLLKIDNSIPRGGGGGVTRTCTAPAKHIVEGLSSSHFFLLKVTQCIKQQHL